MLEYYYDNTFREYTVDSLYEAYIHYGTVLGLNVIDPETLL